MIEFELTTSAPLLEPYKKKKSLHYSPPSKPELGFDCFLCESS